MSKSVVRCRCGHQILAKEVLRTDLYERSAGRDYVYVKFRCTRCKRLGQIFIAENKWDWSVLDPSRNELNDAERDRFLDETPISSLECINFRQQLADVFSLAQLQKLVAPVAETSTKLEDKAQAEPAIEDSEDRSPELQEREIREREIREREVKEHRGLRNIGDRANSDRNSPERIVPERGEDKSAINKPGSNAPGSSLGDDADDAASKS
ncbi:MAG: hypothetical protein JWN98_774 [Abditibacteriota bacterium]|nr:hypothetical protein [Abditibacteriota bacterium]